MAEKTLVVIESPWEDRHGDLAEFSMRPFVEGLCELNEWRLVYRTFTTEEELHRLLNGEAFDGKRGRTLVYVSCHGGTRSGYLSAGIRDPIDIKLTKAGAYLEKAVEGVWLGACDVATTMALESFIKDGGAFWAGGYRCSVDWEAAMTIDIAVLQTCMQARESLSSRDRVVKVIGDALQRFNPGWYVGGVDNEDDVELAAGVRVVARDKRSGFAEDMTTALLDDLGWERSLPRNSRKRGGRL